MALARPNYTYTGRNRLVLENHTVGQVYVLYLESSGTLGIQGDYKVDVCVCGGGMRGEQGKSGWINDMPPYYGEGGGAGGKGGTGAQIINQFGIVLPKGSHSAAIAAEGGTSIFMGMQSYPNASVGGDGGSGGGMNVSGMPGGQSNKAGDGKPGSGGNSAFNEISIRLGGGGGGGCGGYNSAEASGGMGAFNGGRGGYNPTTGGTGEPAKGYGGGGGGGSGSGSPSYLGSGPAGALGGTGGSGVVIIRFRNSPPTTPGTITTTGNRAGQPAVSVVSISTDPDGDSVSYVWEQRSDTGAYSQIGITTQPTITFNVPSSGATFTRRCKAADSQGGESAYITGADMLINYNSPPVISGNDAALGTFDKAPPTWTGSASDPDGDEVTVEIRLNNTLLSKQSGTEVSINIDLSERWRKTVNGNYTLAITATDPKGASAIRTLTFVKRENQFEFFRGQSTFAKPAKFNFNITPPRSAWGDATVEFWATNNGNDPADDIVWQSIPSGAIGDSNNPSSTVVFENAHKSSEYWCFAVHGVASEGASGKPAVLKSMQISVSAEYEEAPAARSARRRS